MIQKRCGSILSALLTLILPPPAYPLLWNNVYQPFAMHLKVLRPQGDRK